jgi:hypothetical protein
VEDYIQVGRDQRGTPIACAATEITVERPHVLALGAEVPGVSSIDEVTCKSETMGYRWTTTST